MSISTRKAFSWFLVIFIVVLSWWVVVKVVDWVRTPTDQQTEIVRDGMQGVGY